MAEPPWEATWRALGGEVPPADAGSRSTSTGGDGAHHGSSGGSGTADTAERGTAQPDGKRDAHCGEDAAEEGLTT